MRQDIGFRSNGRHLLGHLYLPDEHTVGERLPAVVVVGPASGTKGQVPAVYAERLSALGYAALAFDHTGYGESEGYPRSDEDPFAKIEDVKNAVTFLTSRAEVDAARIAAVGARRSWAGVRPGQVRRRRHTSGRCCPDRSVPK
ncbi:alpha/beta hydrolase, partial [Streptomyces prunicolor]|uniref:alpha/beta hydrolase n=1 Tax=Streptomyces prunicolor TaxID=67348 RepID=UPI0033C8D64B